MKSLKFIYFNEDFVEKGEAYNLSHIAKVESKENYDNFINNSSPVTIRKWKIFKKYFLEFTQNCPICEQGLNEMDDIDHFRPKNHYWWLAYDYKNYVIMCDYCNRVLKIAKFPLEDETKKVEFETKQNISDEDPLLFNPLKDNPEILFQIRFMLSSKGRSIIRIEPLQTLDKNSYEFRKAERTIDIFELNNESIPGRFNLMEKNYSALYWLLKFRYKYIKNPTRNNKKLFFEAVKNTFGTHKNGLAIIVLKGQIIWDTPID